MIEITDFNIPELDIYARLSEVQLRRYYEPEPGIFLAETATVIARALEAGYEPVRMTCVDMFVSTPNFETVCLLKKRK